MTITIFIKRLYMYMCTCTLILTGKRNDTPNYCNIFIILGSILTFWLNPQIPKYTLFRTTSNSTIFATSHRVFQRLIFILYQVCHQNGGSMFKSARETQMFSQIYENECIYSSQFIYDYGIRYSKMSTLFWVVTMFLL